MRGEYARRYHGLPLIARFTPTCVGNTRIAGRCMAHRCRFTPTCVGNTHAASTSGDRCWRFTPTCVGNTDDYGPAYCAAYGSPPHAWGILRTMPLRSRRTAVHPHMRGEYPHDTLSPVRHRRFTPTCVGNTCRVTRCCMTVTAVHPHMRGEYYCMDASAVRIRRFTPTCVGNTHVVGQLRQRLTGSPPHAWGIRVTSTAACSDMPVHPHMRGEYARMACHACSITVHPHMRGEYRSAIAMARRCAGGSPPHAWGIRDCAMRHDRRLTGSPPHAWGIRQPFDSRSSADVGSPPHAWGIRSRCTASAGAEPVHPHMRGEYVAQSH